jgi:Exportin 1-like protein
VGFPEEWPSAFQDLLRLLPLGPGMADMFCRLLVSIDEDIISLEISRCGSREAPGLLGCHRWRHERRR